MNDPLKQVIKKYENHPSIKMIKESCELNQSEFKPVTVNEILLQIQKLNSKRASPLNSIPAKILKQNADIFAVLIQQLFNSSLSECYFPKELKAGEISSLFKSLDAFLKKNYTPITVLSSVSKIYERVLENQVKSHALSFLSPLLCAFREGCGTQNALWNPTYIGCLFIKKMLNMLFVPFKTVSHDPMMVSYNLILLRS